MAQRVPREDNHNWDQEIDLRRGTISLGREQKRRFSYILQFDYSDDEKSWRSQALCRDMDTDLFFPERGEGILEAFMVCQGCAVRHECLESALASGKDSEGVRGGLTPHERREVRAEWVQGISLAKLVAERDAKRQKKLAKAQTRERMFREAERRAKDED